MHRPLENESPAEAATSNRADFVVRGGTRKSISHPTVPVNSVFELADGSIVRCRGRVAWTLIELIRAGSGGVAPVERPAPRWSDYVAKLRGKGLIIETVEERHAGRFPGRHGRYVLQTPVRLLATEEIDR